MGLHPDGVGTYADWGIFVGVGPIHDEHIWDGVDGGQRIDGVALDGVDDRIDVFFVDAGSLPGSNARAGDGCIRGLDFQSTWRDNQEDVVGIDLGLQSLVLDI